MRLVADMLTAVRLLTVVPIGRREGEHPARYFPLVGWLFGALAAGIASGAAALDSADGLGALLTAAVIVTAWALLSGFMHLDGLADSADGIGVRGDAKQRLEVMRDSSIGAFGVIAVVLVLVLEVAAIAMIVES
ncbi:MAG: adenosylcobinamide-GDP ribazoletransferase, partial [Actinomycetota bacterium]|nr:adenosylcobinamide-GDP ribazoletransferase [Actinomycetota bacterium]